MRISDQQLKAIVQEVKVLDPNAAIYLYGSRINDTLKGGDIDIAIVSNQFTIRNKVQLQISLMDILEGLRLDVLVVEDETMPFWQLIKPMAIYLNTYAE
jgi:predicted nucleotidyltransferase